MIDDTVRWLQQMHQVQQEPDFTLFPVQFESDFQREFGIGDEQPIKPINIHQGYEDAGQLPEDFC